MPVYPELLAANRDFAAAFTKGDLRPPPAKQLAVLVCMDARIDPAKALGLREGDAHIIRNAGGRAEEALRSLAISQRFLGTREIIVIHHTDCGMMTFSNDDIRAKIAADLGEEAAAVAEEIDFHPFDDLEQSVRDDVALIRSSPLITAGSPVTGFIYDVKTGQLHPVD